MQFPTRPRALLIQIVVYLAEYDLVLGARKGKGRKIARAWGEKGAWEKHRKAYKSIDGPYMGVIWASRSFFGNTNKKMSPPPDLPPL